MNRLMMELHLVHIRLLVIIWLWGALSLVRQKVWLNMLHWWIARVVLGWGLGIGIDVWVVIIGGRRHLLLGMRVLHHRLGLLHHAWRWSRH